jgi:hypothetical protein
VGVEGGSSGSHCLKNWLWKRLRTCRKTDSCMMIRVFHCHREKERGGATAVMLRNRRRQRHSLELGHSRVNKRKQNTIGHAKKSHGADKSRMRSAIAAHTLRPTENTVLIARMQTALAGNNSQLWNVAGRATNVLIADRRHQMGPMICHSGTAPSCEPSQDGAVPPRRWVW